MKQFRVYFRALLCAAMLAGCAIVPKEKTTSTAATEPPQTTLSQAATTVTAAPTETVAVTVAPTEATLPQLAQPSKSTMLLPGVDVEDVIRYFNEVCLGAEFINSGDPTVLQKWTAPIYYYVHGSPTQEDLQVLREFALHLNMNPDFPGIFEIQEEDGANLDIFFCTQEELLSKLGNNFLNTDGGVTFWYRNNEIYNAIICVRTDLDQQLRNSVILEELYNGLGPIQDTDLRPDSIIYSGFSIPQTLTEVDDLILKLLYHPDMRCGMNQEDCEAVIRKLYQ